MENIKSEQLPHLMVAINGARPTKDDHPNIPILVPEIISEIEACISVSATGFHVHVRDKNGQHSLDAQLYLAMLKAFEPFRNGVYIQFSIEQAGKFNRDDQYQLISSLPATPISVCFREIYRRKDDEFAIDFYRLAQLKQMDIQHVFFNPEELATFCAFWQRYFGIVDDVKALFVLGSVNGVESAPAEVVQFTSVIVQKKASFDWAVSAYGSKEFDCLYKARELGGKVRIGFENSLRNRDRSIAESNADRVRDYISSMSI